ncbi:MAG: dienelactone hydrolase family protein [Ilumatobacteraceae bacterium]
MGEMITFQSNGHTCGGYLATPKGGSGSGVLVIQEWWGLVPHIKDVVDRFAAAGFVALAPDLYHGESSTEPDGAGKLMMALNLQQAGKDMSGAITVLQEKSGKEKIGVVGYCMGGGLALVISCQRPDAVAACAPHYGVIPWASAQPDWSKLEAKVEGHYAELDHSFPPSEVHALQDRLRGLGKDATLHVYPGADHAFFNDTRPEVYNATAAKSAWDATVELFRSTLG